MFHKYKLRSFVMTNKKIWLGILAIVLVFGMTVVGCGDDGGGKVDAKYRGTYKSFAYSGTTSLTTIEYTYIISANKAEYTSKTNGLTPKNNVADFTAHNRAAAVRRLSAAY
jgi:hypothetical protein